ncbi:MAG: hypothetical protein AABX38_04135 [Candidatus Micrarchaeota archaeon]
MVKEEKYKGTNIYLCDVCNLRYNKKKLAEACEDFCKKYKSCSLEITKHAVKTN